MLCIRRATTCLAVALLGATLVGAPSQSATSAPAPSVRLEPADLTRGPDIAVPHVEGDDLVDGSRRVELPGARAYLLGPSGDAHVVGTTSRNGLTRKRILRVEADGTLTTLLTGVAPHEVVLAEDGRRLVSGAGGAGPRGRIRVWSAVTGDLLATKAFAGAVSTLAARGGRVLVGGWDRGVLWWWTGSGRTSAVTTREPGAASITHDLLATYTGDPYQGGCTRLSRLSRPGRTLWQSCTERIDAFSPDGTRIATVDLLSDGIGPGRVWQREVDGTRLATYSAGRSQGWFGAFSWESPTTMLLETYGERQTAVVRCELGDCENATDPVRTPDPRPAQNISVENVAVRVKPTRSYAARAGAFQSLT